MAVDAGVEAAADNGPIGDTTDGLTLSALGLRGAIGGMLMGLANLVPGISGGTMLLAAGVYPAFIRAIAELTRLRFRVRPTVLLGAIVASAALAILLLAGALRTLVVEERWLMYSLFIGLTLGGVPLVWRLARPASTGLWVGATGAFALMVIMAVSGGAGGSREASGTLLFLSGLAGASAMILPGVSGGYLLLLLGQYEPILGAIDTLKSGLLGSDGGGFDLSLVMQSMSTVIPVGLGVVLGVVGVSNLLRWLLARYEKPALGALLGLLVGALVGLYPFQQPTPPEPGFMHRGVVLSAAELSEVDPDDWPLDRFAPSAAQVATAAAAIALGLAATVAISRIGGRKEEKEGSSYARV
jgi:putative membrane protein